jgi:hypothetical protein
MGPKTNLKKSRKVSLQVANARRFSQSCQQSGVAASQDSGGDSSPLRLPDADIDNWIAEDALRVHRDDFDRRLEERGLRREIVPSNGNCMCASAAANLGRTGPNASMDVRTKTANNYGANQDDFKHLVGAASDEEY